jgi:exopolysaccharide biosynthesis WecB/TagA/CpsF family protein
MPGKWIPLIKCLLAAIFNRHYFKDTPKAKLSGSEFIYDVAELAAQNNYKVFLLGGFDFGHGNTGDLTAQKLKQMYPNLHIAGIHTAGSSDASEDAKTIEIINQADPQILFIAYGPGSQEKWINRNKDKLNPMVSFCLGGTFDYVSGAKRKAPSWAASRGLEGVLRPFFAERSMSAKLSRLKRAWGGIFNFLRLLLSQKH